MTYALRRKAQYSLNTTVITQLNLLRELEDLGVQLVSHGQASVHIVSTYFTALYSGGNSIESGK